MVKISEEFFCDNLSDFLRFLSSYLKFWRTENSHKFYSGPYGIEFFWLITLSFYKFLYHPNTSVIKLHAVLPGRRKIRIAVTIRFNLYKWYENMLTQQVNIRYNFRNNWVAVVCLLKKYWRDTIFIYRRKIGSLQ